MADEAADVFAYGTLLFPEVMLAVTRTRFLAQPAMLRGYARRRVRGASYPGLRCEPGAVTEGRLYRAVDPAALDRLDAFEGNLYARERVLVELDASLLEAITYLIRPAFLHRLSEESWDPAAFRSSPAFDRFAGQPAPSPRQARAAARAIQGGAGDPGRRGRSWAGSG